MNQTKIPVMSKLDDILPTFIAQIRKELTAKGRSDIADQFQGLGLARWTHDQAANAVYIHLSGQRPLNLVEVQVIGTRHGECIEIEGRDGIVTLDLDNFNRVTGIEVLNCADIAKRLEEAQPCNGAYR
jgi:hypothetical protein